MPYGKVESGRLPNSAHESRPWRIREIVPDFTLEDVWALPVQGGAEDFPELLVAAASIDPARSDSQASRFLWELRDHLGKWFGLGRTTIPSDAEPAPASGELAIPGDDETSLKGRLPADLRASAEDADELGLQLFDPLYRTDTEAAAEISNRTVHGVLHLAWVDLGDGVYQGQMAVYVKPRGRFGQGYMALIKPFRHLIVYPALMRQFGAAWRANASSGDRPKA